MQARIRTKMSLVQPDSRQARRQINAKALDARLERLLRLRGATGAPADPDTAKRLTDRIEQDKRQRDAFTLIEMLVVVLVILALAGIAWPVAMKILGDSSKEATQQLINLSAAAIEGNSSQPVVNLKDGSVRRLWDFNGDEILDGDPAKDPGFNATQKAEAEEAGYDGFLATAAIEAKKRYVEQSSGRLRDPWGGYLHIRFHKQDFGTAGFGIWSNGPDRKPDTDDDLTSWTRD